MPILNQRRLTSFTRYRDHLDIPFTLTVNDMEISAIANVRHYLGYPAKVSGPPEDCHPAEDPFIEISEVRLVDHNEKLIDISFLIHSLPNLYEAIENALYEELQDREDSP